MGKKATKKPPVEKVNFEEAVEEIQKIVRQLEEGDLGLDESLEQYEVGVRLIRNCHSTLELAEQRIKVLTDVDADGNPVLTDFDASATIDQNQQTAGRRKKKTATVDDKESQSEGSSLF